MSKSFSPSLLHSVFGRKGTIYPAQSETFAHRERAKAGKFARECTKTIQHDPHLKRFLSSSMVELLNIGGKSQHLRAKSVHSSGHLPTLPEKNGKCSFIGPIGVTIQQYQESDIWCVECPTCGARRNMEQIRDRQRFPSHPARKTPPSKGEPRWTVHEQAWVSVEK